MDSQFWGRQPTSPWLNAYVTRVLTHLWEPDPIQSVRGLGYPFEPTDSLYFFPANDFNGPILVCQWATGVAIFFEGTDGRVAHITNLVQGWTHSVSTSSGVNPAFNNAAQDLINRWVGPGSLVKPGYGLFLCGHSYGGGTALALAYGTRVAEPGQTIKIWTYGCPRPGNANFQQRMSSEFHTRWFNDGDPVRFMPPHSDEVPSLSLFEGGALLAGINTQCQLQNGFQMQSDGNVSNTNGEPSPLTAVAYSIGAWCISPQGFAAGAHATTVYQSRFAGNIQSDKEPVPVIPKPAPGPPLVITSSQLATIRSRGEDDINAAINAGTAPPLIVSIPGIPDPSAPRYVRRKMGTIWTVQYQGQVVAVGPGKRHAGTIRRRLNRALQATLLTQ